MVQQINGGTWLLSVSAGGGTPAYTVYVWSRNNMQAETYATEQANPLPIKQACTLTPVSGAPSFTTKAQFLTWVCQQIGGSPTLQVVDQASTYTDSTHSCG